MAKNKALYQNAFDAMAPSIQKPNETLNSPNLKGGITISQELLPDKDLVVGDIVLMKVENVDPDKGEVHFSYVNKQATSGGVTTPPVTANLNTL